MDVDSLKGSTFNKRDEFNGNLKAANKNNYKEIYYMDGKHELQQQQQQRFNFDDPQQINLNGRPVGLRRQPTKYPHGLGVCVQTVNDEEQYNHQQQLQQVTNYSRASTLRSSWDGTKQQQQQQQYPQEMKCQSHDNQQQPHHHHQSQRKYHIGMLNSPENLAELQVRRYKYPLTGNYYLDPQEASKKSPLLTLDYAKRFCKWKYLRWPLIFTASVLVFFGLITYSIWLHDVSIARERYLQQRKLNDDGDVIEDSNEIVTATTLEMTTLSTFSSLSTLAASASSPSLATERSHGLQESTILRAISTRSRIRPKEQKLTTVEYALSKGVLGWDKQRKDAVTAAKEAPVMDVTTMVSEEAALIPANVVRFTSGHQNSFGIPIEDDERILRLINGLFPSNQPATTSSVDSLVKVSPTIPPVTQNKPTAPMTNKASVPDNKCYSTSLSMCQGVLDYDLTYNVSIQLTPEEIKDYQTLVNSNCSARSVEFMCAVLEPECRPSHIGILPPCRRICKAILEACSEIIANSDTLTATFDCNLYPDSNDPHRCEDPTRRKGYCYENEFECYDRSCIPQQWQCDNIKDCAVGEDEDNCLICDQPDEFRCRSNEKCVAETARCDMKYDCFDGSDEDDCQEFGEGSLEGGLSFDEADINAFPRVFSYASILSPNQTNEKLYTYITAATDGDSATKYTLHEVSNRTSGVSQEEVTNSVPGEGPKGFVNFRDSKEIMMTSDSENKFKFSSARENRTTNRFSSSTTPLQPAASNIISITTEPPKIAPQLQPSPKVPLAACAAHQLRCVSGKCITVDQLCDKIIDCPDGFDELSCTYKDRTTTQRIRGTTILPNNYNIANREAAAASNSTRTDKRTIRTTTIKRKVKP
ncbi:uncharacterized protein LOC119607653 [Lucilia sericata]|uniref:uncharacterized protein LOC119607653 n=1 Tax=Lucilia sericata TaxID=13632 RepID=UPI0018A8663D|nr:uncharacterized protein LOC119607653 [Lucilia sericata]XP_037817592.1 uncharacterized protein LOC119607653 [Lucilia sericata]XP_037817603.1 uncharacterized protein LOC119607653 [Lucilia sericata]XP_037817614.1 uncharacterized protein LOC119607653 [Lucilia sericata]XP_037817625.1 uncharacterized protein LOC119607653 [Lucilia sericata]XP_037817637.1 uncharacterized protein LOC119607653 [Lucilia sericata]